MNPISESGWNWNNRTEREEHSLKGVERGLAPSYKILAHCCHMTGRYTNVRPVKLGHTCQPVIVHCLCDMSVPHDDLIYMKGHYVSTALMSSFKCHCWQCSDFCDWQHTRYCGSCHANWCSCCYTRCCCGCCLTSCGCCHTSSFGAVVVVATPDADVVATPGDIVVVTRYTTVVLPHQLLWLRHHIPFSWRMLQIVYLYRNCNQQWTRCNNIVASGTKEY